MGKSETYVNKRDGVGVATREFLVNGRRGFARIETDADLSVFNEVFVDLDYRKLDKDVKSAQSCVIDVGAHRGYFALYCAFLNPDVDIFAFEPEAKNFSELKENLKTNRVRNVFAKNVAVGGESGEGRIYLSKDSHNHSLVIGGGESGNENFSKVHKISINDLFEKYVFGRGHEFCDVLKMDCEGSEFEIFENINEKVLGAVGVFYIEYHKYLPEFDVSKIENKLLQTGFKVQNNPSRYDDRMGYIFAIRRAV